MTKSLDFDIIALGDFMDKKTMNLVLSALFIALVFIATAFLRIPSPDITGAGQVHLGTTIVFIIALVFGPKMAAISSLGMVLFNLVFSLAPWAPINLISRPILGLIFGSISHLKGASGKNLWLNILAAIAGGLWLIPSMYVGQVIMFGVPWAVPMAFVPNNAMQIVLAIVIGLPIATIVNTNFSKLNKK
ncbi:MAG: ECF transporter S component [Defluviitaleaceae bacterium]|nr:ECF transporter S component [Defluviitaleaceae bacterium]